MNLTVERLLNLYSKRINELKEQGAKNAFGEGYYKITSIEQIKLFPNWLELYVRADWKPLEEKQGHSLGLIVRLGDLYGRDSKGPKELDPALLLNAIITVKEVEVYTQEWNGELKTKFKANWEILKLGETKKEEIQSEIKPVLPFDYDTEQVDSYIKSTDSGQINDLLNSKPNF